MNNQIKLTVNTIIPYVHYSNPSNDKEKIFKENREKSGIYRWYSKSTNKSYIGSSQNLSKRFYTYYTISKLNNSLNHGASAIYKAILKYNIDNFSLDILEYCEQKFLYEREQYYFDILNPEYNILKVAGSRNEL